jgi:hypothetical protein
MATTKSTNRMSWLDDKGEFSLIDERAKQLESYVKSIADGKIEKAELEGQERRVVNLMKGVESILDDATHAKVTELLCELTAYDMMQLLFEMQQSRNKTVWRP